MRQQYRIKEYKLNKIINPKMIFLLIIICNKKLMNQQIMITNSKTILTN